MQLRRIRLLLWTTGIVLHLASALTLGWAYLWPSALDVKPVQTQDSARLSQPNTTPRLSKLELKQFDQLWGKRLRDPLSGAAVAIGTQHAGHEPSPVPNLKLLGTILEPGRSLAMFAMSPSTIELKAVGETVGDAGTGVEVVAIERKQVIVRYQGALLTLAIQEVRGN